MEVKATEKTFHLLPVLSVTKHINPLTEAAKKTFKAHWSHYYTIKIGWLNWSNF